MADVIKLSCNSLRYSCSLLTSITSSSNRFLPLNHGLHKRMVSVSDGFSVGCDYFSPVVFRPKKQFTVLATVTETEPPKWWERNARANMIDIHSTQEFLTALIEAGDKLVIAEFYGTWCASCRALFPKLCRTAVEHKDIVFLKVNFDENKPMCKSLNVKVLPYFIFYRGADGQLESFSCSLGKFQKIRDAIKLHNTARCSIGPPKGVGDLNFEDLSTPKEKLIESSDTYST